MTRALSAATALCVLAACSGRALPTLPVSGAAFEPSIYQNDSGYKTIFAFDGADGSLPEAPVIAVNGQLYGTTSWGGNWSNYGGTIFTLSIAGKQKVLHSFGRPHDGQSPHGALATLDGKLYGTTHYGGKYGGGTVYSSSTTGDERVLHSFGKGKDGKLPSAGLTVMNGMLYGTTTGGGKHGGGAVFSITTSGTEHIIYNFKGHADGADPGAGLTVFEGALYGTTVGGACNGTAFRITSTGKETVLHRFDCGSSSDSDGAYPDSDLIAVNNLLYGTTSAGGRGYEGQTYGTVFSLSPSGKERVLHSFGYHRDGADPEGALLYFNGVLYGTTSEGGADDEGTVFRITRSGNERVLYSFGARPDGENPYAGLIDFNGKLYGTTSDGGDRLYGYGTVYAISP
jgi:uncharacterized repeat protein (TIGR03803 family)